VSKQLGSICRRGQLPRRHGDWPIGGTGHGVCLRTAGQQLANPTMPARRLLAQRCSPPHPRKKKNPRNRHTEWLWGSVALQRFNTLSRSSEQVSCLSIRPSMPARHFPPPWSVEEQGACFVVRDHNGQALTYVYFKEEPGRRY